MAEGKKILVYVLNLSGRTDKKPVKVVALDHENRVAGREEDFSGSSFCVRVRNSLKFWIMWMYVIQNRNTSDRYKNPRNALSRWELYSLYRVGRTPCSLLGPSLQSRVSSAVCPPGHSAPTAPRSADTPQLQAASALPTRPSSSSVIWVSLQTSLAHYRSSQIFTNFKGSP